MIWQLQRDANVGQQSSNKPFSVLDVLYYEGQLA